MDKKIDIHTHILPGVDDGSKSIEDSLKIIEYLKSISVTDIVLTSHYIKNTRYDVNVLERQKIFKELKEELMNNSINVYLGNEVYLCDDIVSLYKNKEITTINNSRYMLVECPLTGYIKNLENILCDLNDIGIIPIIAHPERYSFLQKEPEKIYELLAYNILLQCNVDSLIGKYGTSAKKLMKWLLKKDLVTCVATDTHRVGDIKALEKSYNKLNKLVGKERYYQMIYTNPKKILENDKIVR